MCKKTSKTSGSCAPCPVECINCDLALREAMVRQLFLTQIQLPHKRVQVMETSQLCKSAVRAYRVHVHILATMGRSCARDPHGTIAKHQWGEISNVTFARERWKPMQVASPPQLPLRFFLACCSPWQARPLQQQRAVVK
jgi:hypothetical protein